MKTIDVKFKDSRWILLNYAGGNYSRDVFFVNWPGVSEHLKKMVIHKYGDVINDRQYTISGKGVKVCNHDSGCTGMWPNKDHTECGGIGILAII